MSTSIKLIKSHLTDDTIYPITKSNAVYIPGSTTDTVDDHLTSLETLVGTGDISNINNTITGAIGSQALTTVARSISGAINELNNKFINDFNPMVKYKGFTYTISSLAAGGTLAITATQMGKADPTGYEPLAIYRINTNNVNLIPYSFDLSATGTSSLLYVKNIGTTAITNHSIYFGMTWVKGSLYGPV